MPRLSQLSNIFLKGKDPEGEKNRRFVAPKGQWYLVSAVMLSGIFLIISTMFKGYFLVDPSTAITNEDYYFWSLQDGYNEILNSDISDCYELDRSLDEYITLSKAKMAQMGYFLFMNKSVDCNIVSSGYSYRKEVNIDNLGSQLTNYQMQVTVHSGSGTDSGNDVYLDGHSLNWPEDIRFTTLNDDELDYWIESYDANSASFWVEFDYLSASTTTDFYIYYGDDTASTSSSYDDTFTKDYEESGLVGLWHMDDGTSPTADSSGNGNDGTLNGGVTWVGSDGGNWDSKSPVQQFSTGDSLSFDGIDGYVDVGNSATLNPASKMSVEAWIYPERSLPSGYEGIVARYYTAGDSTTSWALSKDFDTWCFYIQQSDLTLKTSPTSPVSLTTWSHVVGVADGSKVRLYVNGVEVGSGTDYDSTILQATRTVTIGKYRTPGTWGVYEGKIDEVRIYNRALSEDEIEAHFERRLYADPEPIISSWGSEELPSSSINSDYGILLASDKMVLYHNVDPDDIIKDIVPPLFDCADPEDACYLADFYGLCEGLNIVCGSGYQAACCNDYPPMCC